MILGQSVAQKDAAHGPSEYAREYDQADRGGVHGLVLCSKLGTERSYWLGAAPQPVKMDSRMPSERPLECYGDVAPISLCSRELVKCLLLLVG
jgi:hypothetical protein